MGAHVVKVENLSKRFGDLLVLDKWNLEVFESESVALLGPSGCGKTTFLKILAGIEESSEGMVRSNFEKLGFVFQEPRLIPWRSVKDNLRFVCSDEKKIEEIVEKMGLIGFENYFPSEISGGMKQRVNLARALSIIPDLLILDEPFFSLDLPIKVGIMRDLSVLRRKEGLTMITVTHDVKEALCLADRILILSNRPSRVLKEFKVDLKDEERKLSSRAFTDLEGKLVEILLADIYSDSSKNNLCG